MQSRRPLTTPMLPDNAPFAPEQRAWLNGFFAGIFSTDHSPVEALSDAEALALLGRPSGATKPLDDRDDGEAPWHDPSVPMDERMALAEGRPLRRRMMAAMAQQDCGQCGYNCETYADALVARDETKLNLCVPGGKETARMLKKLAEALDGADVAPSARPGDQPGSGGAAISTPALPRHRETGADRGFSRDNPAPAVFLSRRRLNAESSDKETHHVEFDLTKSGLSYDPGDAFGIYANNAVALVKAISRHLGMPLDEPISAEGQTRTLGDWLMHAKSLAPAPDALFALLAETSPAPAEREKLKRMAEGEGADGMDVLAALHAFPHLAPAPFRLLEALDPLQPRLYSISSSPRAAAGRVSLTVDVVSYAVDDRLRFGVASTFLSNRVQEGDLVRVYVQRAPSFRLPANGATPIIMIGPGTGIAPFRGFLQERRVTKASGKAWLFFGHRREASDFFYRDELEEFLAKGTLTRLATAWSRDVTPKAYVQDRMREQGADLWSWLEEGAHLYVCGDAQRMAKDVDKALHEIVQRHGQTSLDQAKTVVSGLRQDGRYQADVY